jgi:hypothetical protein
MPYALCPMPYAPCPCVPHLSEKGYISANRFFESRIERGVDSRLSVNFPRSGASGALQWAGKLRPRQLEQVKSFPPLFSQADRQLD